MPLGFTSALFEKTEASMKRILATALTASLILPLALPLRSAQGGAIAAAACFIPGVGWVSCSVIAGVTVAGVGFFYVVNNLPGHPAQARYRLPAHQVQIYPEQPTPQARPRPTSWNQEVRSTNNQQFRVVQYGAVSDSNCAKIAQRIRNAGYQIRKQWTRPNTLGSGGVLKRICYFETNAPDDFYPSYNYRYNPEDR
jgi:hypothetical protein